MACNKSNIGLSLYQPDLTPLLVLGTDPKKTSSDMSFRVCQVVRGVLHSINILIIISVTEILKIQNTIQTVNGITNSSLHVKKAVVFGHTVNPTISIYSIWGYMFIYILAVFLPQTCAE